MNKKNQEPPMISVAHIRFINELDQFIHSLLTQVIHELAYTRVQYWTEPITNKTIFYLTGVSPFMEKDIRELIDKYRDAYPGYIIRLTKRAHFDAMLTVTITRKVNPKPRYMTIAG